MNLTIFQYAKSNPWVGLKFDNALYPTYSAYASPKGPWTKAQTAED